MKRVFLVTLVLVLFTALGAAAAESAANAAKVPARATNPHVRNVDDPAQDVSTDSGLPTVSKFQMPGIVPNVGCGGGDNGDPCVDDGGLGGGDYTQGGCNCSRTCDGVCKPIGNNQCKSPLGGGCSDCTNASCI